MATLTFDPVQAHLIGARIAATTEVLHAIRAAHDAAAQLSGTPPAWLHARHLPLLGRVVHGLRTRQTALLAAPTGHGKTWIALAAHQMLHPAAPAFVVAPAALRAQWLRVAASVGLSLTVISHEQVSRGVPSLPTSALIIVDEAHRLRNPSTRRHRHFSESVRGRTLLFLTATPVVNRVEDLGAILNLGVADDALRRDGVPSLRRLIAAGALHPALARLVHLPESRSTSGPTVSRRRLRPPLDDLRRSALHRLDALRFSRDRAITALLRGTAERALSSSCAACRAVLQRYARLLAHAEDAARDGRVVSRAEVMAATAGLGDQLLLWSMLPGSELPADLVLEDAAQIATIIADLTAVSSELDPLVHLAQSSPDPTLIFTAWRSTARMLVDRLGLRTAWCTGSGSGIGATRLPREAVLGHFGASLPSALAPHQLVATDVAAEGLDLVRIRRVIHADLPWTPARLAQREGRARRAGSTAASIAIVTVLPPHELEVRMGIEARLHGKAAAMQRASRALTAPGWTLSLPPRESPASAPMDTVLSIVEDPSVRVATALCAFLDESHDVALIAVRADGTADESAPALNVLLQASASAQLATLKSLPASLQSAIAAETRRRLALRAEADWLDAPAAADARLLDTRVRRLAKLAVQSRAVDALARYERIARWCAQGHTAADRRLTEQLVALDQDALVTALASYDRGGRFAPMPARTPPELRLVAAICFIPPGGDTTFDACPSHAPYSSTSTAR